MMDTKLNSFMPNRKLAYIWVAGFVFVALLAGYFFLSGKENYPVNRLIRYNFTVTNKTGKILHDKDVWLFAPVAKTSSQKTIKLSASLPYQTIKDKFGNQLLHFRFAEFLPYASKVITVNAMLHMADKPNKIRLRNAGVFLGPEKYIEVENKDLKSLAGKLAKSGKWATEKNIFRWVSSMIKYAGYLAEDRGALYAYRTRQGDCTEYSYLFTALSRIAGVPTRSMGGVVYHEDKLLNSKDFHNWSEVYLNGAWHVVDPQNKVFAENQSHYIALRVLPGEADSSLDSSQGFVRASSELKVEFNF